MVNGTRVNPISVVGGRYVFTVPPTDSEIRLASRAARPSDRGPWIGDRRCLGIMLSGLTWRCGEQITPIPLDHPDLAEGWWDPEWHGPNVLCRWTNGDAVIPGPGPQARASLLEVTVAGTLRYPITTERAPVPARPAA
jgi:hypothetical protein